MNYKSVLFLISAFLIPVVILYLCHKFSLLNKIGSVLLAYLAGLIIGNLGILPEEINKTQDLINMISIPIAIPLLLFSLNIRGWFRLAGKTMLSLVLGIIAVIVVVIAGYFMFTNSGIKELWKIAGLMVTVYTGATANMAALKLMLNVDASDYILTHTYDMFISVIYLFFLITVAQRIFLLILPPFKKSNSESEVFDGQFESYSGIFRRKTFLNLLPALLLALIIFAVGAGLSLLVGKNSQMVVIVLSLTTFGILASLVPRIHKIEKTFETGMYFILVFSYNVSSMADINQLVNINFSLIYYITWVVFGSLFLHVLLAAVFKVDADTVIITSNALINSAPFVPMVASSLKNKEIIISGITVGIIGYAVGNYLGYIIAILLKQFG